MDYLEFVEKATVQDKENIFSKYDGNLDSVPDDLKTFYSGNNPVNVEINCVRFSPADELSTMQAQYSYLNAQFIFATCNGDPIFLHDGHVYTTPHGVKNPKWELLAKDMKTFFLLCFKVAL